MVYKWIPAAPARQMASNIYQHGDRNTDKTHKDQSNIRYNSVRQIPASRLQIFDTSTSTPPLLKPHHAQLLPYYSHHQQLTSRSHLQSQPNLQNRCLRTILKTTWGAWGTSWWRSRKIEDRRGGIYFYPITSHKQQPGETTWGKASPKQDDGLESIFFIRRLDCLDS